MEESNVEELSNVAKVPEKFFVVKSLTLQDLEQSVRNGIWATQAHNEQSFNKAFEVEACTPLLDKHDLTTILDCRSSVLDIFSKQVRRILWLC